MRQSLAFVTVKKNDIASLGLTLTKLQTQTDPVHFAGDLASFHRCGCRIRPAYRSELARSSSRSAANAGEGWRRLG
jgi:hypothetical protein